ncbi:MAG: 4-hydroxy-tetrahydrodipicolinate reductase [Flavobacteriaceae bacterium]|nr:4-hydroxy-tetrahydrodipicolinate reductase [Flavobacteriaceae bacterium]
MRIALLGYGKMGKAIEKMAESRGHSIVLKVTGKSDDFDITTADMAIDFSIPDAAKDNIANCLKNGIPVISGTTGWLNDYENMVTLCRERDGAFIYASNFSLGVNILFEMNRKLAKMMQGLSQYKIDIEEIHHTQKLDAPSGTAITLANCIIENSNYKNWILNEEGTKESLAIKAKRMGKVPGTHIINFNSNVDKISIAHEAYNRDGFALGAVVAAEWLLGKTGIFTMKDVLNIG